MSPAEYEQALQDLMTAFHIDHEQAEALARYFAREANAALMETALEHGDASPILSGSEARRRPSFRRVSVAPEDAPVALALHGTATTIVLLPNIATVEIASSESASIPQSVAS